MWVSVPMRVPDVRGRRACSWRSSSSSRFSSRLILLVYRSMGMDLGCKIEGELDLLLGGSSYDLHFFKILEFLVSIPNPNSLPGRGSPR